MKKTSSMLGWAVVVHDVIEALFSSRSKARTYAGRKGGRVARVRISEIPQK